MKATRRSTSYAELLRDPRWQRKRLEVMQRENFTCEMCKSKDSTLNVHHGYYEKDKMPWEYEAKSLHCFCETCHTKVTSKMCEIKAAVAEIGASKLSWVLAILKGMSRFPTHEQSCVNNITTEVVNSALEGSSNELYDLLQEAKNIDVKTTEDALVKTFSCCFPMGGIRADIKLELLISRISSVVGIKGETLWGMVYSLRRML